MNLNWSNTLNFVNLLISEVSYNMILACGLDHAKLYQIIGPLWTEGLGVKVSSALSLIEGKYEYQKWHDAFLVFTLAWVDLLQKHSSIRESWEPLLVSKINGILKRRKRSADKSALLKNNNLQQVRSSSSGEPSAKKARSLEDKMEDGEDDGSPLQVKAWGDISEMAPADKKDALDALFSALESKVAEVPHSVDVEVPLNLREAMPVFHETLSYLAEAGDFELKISTSVAIEIDKMLHADCFVMEPNLATAAVRGIAEGSAISKTVKSLLALFDEMYKPTPHNDASKSLDSGRAFVRRQVSIEYQSSLYKQPEKKFASLLRYTEVPEETIRSRFRQIFPQQTSIVEILMKIIKQSIGLMVRKVTETVKNRSSIEGPSHLEVLEETYHKTKRATVLSVLPPSQKKVLKEASRTRARRQSNFKPKSSDFEFVACQARPKISTKDLIVDLQEQAYVQTVNDQLHKLEVVISGNRPELFPSNLVERKKKVTAHIELLFAACKKIESEIRTRKSIVYNRIRANIAASDNVKERKREIIQKDWSDARIYCHANNSFSSIQDLIASVFTGTIGYINT